MSRENVRTLQFGIVVVAASNSMTDDELDPIATCLEELGVE
jgi:hypothetical protein